jgi:MarR family transcriptional regulator, lower aerobic nicotinate degradation pathway regulator
MRQMQKAKSIDRAGETTNAEDDYLIGEQIGYLLRVAMQRHRSVFQSMMLHDLTQTQYATLVKLLEQGPVTHNRLGRSIELDAPTIKGVIDRLVTRGFVESKGDPGHKSRRVVDLTPLGLKVTKSAKEVGRTITKVTLAPLSNPERERLAALLKRIS